MAVSVSVVLRACFSACITPNVVCQPSRASMLTGLLPPIEGIVWQIDNEHTDPRGNMMLGGGLLWMCIGIFVMKKMINFDF